jgi:hypothetical protein
MVHLDKGIETVILTVLYILICLPFLALALHVTATLPVVCDAIVTGYETLCVLWDERGNLM